METVLFTRDVLFNLKCNHDDIWQTVVANCAQKSLKIPKG